MYPIQAFLEIQTCESFYENWISVWLLQLNVFGAFSKLIWNALHYKLIVKLISIFWRFSYSFVPFTTINPLSFTFLKAFQKIIKCTNLHWHSDTLHLNRNSQFEYTYVYRRDYLRIAIEKRYNIYTTTCVYDSTIDATKIGDKTQLNCFCFTSINYTVIHTAELESVRPFIIPLLPFTHRRASLDYAFPIQGRARIFGVSASSASAT